MCSARLSPILERMRRRWLRAALVVAAVLLLVRIVAPLAIEGYLEHRLEARSGVTAQIEDVDLDVTSLSMFVEHLRVRGGPQAAATFDLEVPQIRVMIPWSQLLGDEAIRPTVWITAPELSIHELHATDRRGEAPTLATLAGIAVDNGTVHVEPFTGSNFGLTFKHVEIGLEDTSDAVMRSSAGRARIDADVRGGGHVHAHGTVNFFEPTKRWDLEIDVEALEVSTLNGVLRPVLGVDATSGTLDVQGRLVATDKLRGHLQPRFEHLELITPGDGSRRPMTEAVFAEMLRGTDGTMPIERPWPPQGSGPLELQPADGLMRDIIRRGYDRRLDDLDGYFATIGGLEIDLSDGLLQFTDIAIFADHHTVPLPFFFTRTMEVRISADLLDPAEPSAAGRDVPAFKSVRLVEPHLIFVEGPTDQLSQLEFDPDWPDKVSSLPYPTETLEIVDGRIDYFSWKDGPAATAFLDDVDFVLDNMASSRDRPGRGATLHATARLMGQAPLTMTLAYRPGASPADLGLALRVSGFDLTVVDPLARSRFGVDVATGRAALLADLDQTDGTVSAFVDPQLTNLRLLDDHAGTIQHPLRQLILGRALRQRASDPVYVTRPAPLGELPAAVVRRLAQR